MHTICTQFAHTQKQKHTNKTYMQHIEQHTGQDTEQNTDTETNNHAQPQHRTTHLYTNIFDFIVYDNISKSYIIQLYTKFIHFGHLINKVSKITIYILKSIQY